jgi:hypothetical protein
MSRNRRLALTALFLALGMLAAGCDGAITVTNNSTVALSVAVSPPGGGQSMVSPAPGASAVVRVYTPGIFRASAVPTKDWLDFATVKSNLMSALLSNPDAMSPADVASLTKELASIDAQVKAFSSPGAAAAACSGIIDSDMLDDPTGITAFFPIPILGDGTVVASNSGSSIQLTCASTPP